MHIISQLAIILGFTLAGEFIAPTLPITIPGSMIGLVLLYCALSLKIVKLKHIEPTASFLIDNMAFFFVPLTVGLMESWSILHSILIPMLIIVFASTLLTLIVASHTTQILAIKEKETPLDEHSNNASTL